METVRLILCALKPMARWIGYDPFGKNQVELGGTIYTGLVPLFPADGGVKLFFQDARDNRQPAGTKFTRAILPGRKKEGLACVTILADGKPAQKEFLDTFVENDPSGFFFSPYNAISYGTDKIIFTWYDKHGMGRSEYRVEGYYGSVEPLF